MKLERLQSIPESAIAFDTETHLIRPGLLAPPMVCGSVAWSVGVNSAVKGELLDKDQCFNLFRELITGDRVIVGANISYDLLVMAVEGARRGIDFMPAIFDAINGGRIYDILIAQTLNAIAEGTLQEMGEYFSLESVARSLLDREAKVNDAWRLRYAELDGVPIDQWEFEARTYPVDDAINTLECAVAQVRGGPHNKPFRNLHNLAFQQAADWAMHLGAAWGFNVDPAAVNALEAKVLSTREEGLQRFIDAGFFQRDKAGNLITSPKTGAEKQNRTRIKSLICDAYGVSGTCATCAGSGKVPGTTKCPGCGGAGHETCACEYCQGDGKDCSWCDGYGFCECPCRGTGRVPNPKTKKNCPDCDSTGRDLSTAPVPRTPKGAIGIGRDVLSESGDELLIDFAEFSEQDKIRTTYIPMLRKSITEDGRPLPWNLRPNVLVATGRSSYAGGAQTLPREGGVRECVVARPGMALVSCDYGGIELVTHAQSCLWLVGESKLAEALVAGVKAHDKLGAEIIGLDYETFLARRKTEEKMIVDIRQAAKPANFGFPGGMGAPKLVLQQRKQGPDTKMPDGTKYKGLRFCVLMNGAERCGTVKVTEWNDRPMPPTCKECLECAERLRGMWFTAWPENRKYLQLIGQTVDRLGYIVQHVSKRIRGGIEFCSGANSYFQGLAADGKKLALARVAEECFVNKGTALFGCRPILEQHDEIIMEVPLSQLHDSAMRLSEVMVRSMQQVVPDVASAVEAKPAAFLRWYKNAKPVFDSKGCLVPWEPKSDF